MEPGTRIHAPGAADLLEQVVYRRFQTKILQGRGHQAVRNISDQLDGIIDDLLGIINTLQLSGLIEIHQVLVQIQTRRRQQRTGIIVEIRRNPLPFFLLQAYGGIQKQLLLILFHLLQFHLVTNDLALVKDDENDKPYGERQHSYGAKKQHHGYIARASNIKERHEFRRLLDRLVRDLEYSCLICLIINVFHIGLGAIMFFHYKRDGEQDIL